MYLIVLSLHNIVRWIVVFFAVVALLIHIAGWLRHARKWTQTDGMVNTFFTGFLDLEVLLGLILYVNLFLHYLGGGSSFSGVGSFFDVIHPVLMVFAAIFAHTGAAIARRAVDPWKKHRTSALFFIVAIIIILFAIPWSRPLIRLG